MSPILWLAMALWSWPQTKHLFANVHRGLWQPAVLLKYRHRNPPLAWCPSA